MEIQPGKRWPPVVIASVFQTGLNLMRDFLRKGIPAVGIDCVPEHEGFRSIYGKSHLCPDPDKHPGEWLGFMRSLSKQMGSKPVLIAAADIFVSAIGAHAQELQKYFVFAHKAAEVQVALATKEQQYALAERHGLPHPRTAYVRSAAQLEEFANAATFPCLLKPRHQREWDVLPENSPLRGLKLISAKTPTELLASYRLVEPYQPELMAQELIAGPDDSKYCYLSAYAMDGSRLGACVVRELRAFPLYFGSASVVEPVVDPEIEDICDRFLRQIHYAGICEIEVKRDSRTGQVKLIEVNPRATGTGDVAIYTGVDVAWLHYLDLIGETPAPVQPARLNLRHVTLRRDLPSIPKYLQFGLITWGQLLRSYRPPLRFFDFDLHDWRVTLTTLWKAFRGMAGNTLRALKLRA